jgi:hypothetical protein
MSSSWKKLEIVWCQFFLVLRPKIIGALCPANNNNNKSCSSLLCFHCAIGIEVRIHDINHNEVSFLPHCWVATPLRAAELTGTLLLS